MAKCSDTAATIDANLTTAWDGSLGIIQRVPKAITDSYVVPVTFQNKDGKKRDVVMRWATVGPTIHDAAKNADAGLAAWWDGYHAIIQNVPRYIHHQDSMSVLYQKANGQVRQVNLSLVAA